MKMEVTIFNGCTVLHWLSHNSFNPFHLQRDIEIVSNFLLFSVTSEHVRIFVHLSNHFLRINSWESSWSIRAYVCAQGFCFIL